MFQIRHDIGISNVTHATDPNHAPRKLIARARDDGPVTFIKQTYNLAAI